MSNTPIFTNTAQPCKAERPGNYGFAHPSPLLFNFSNLLQRVVSQAGTYHYHKRFHDYECGIYKAEGGCRIEDTGELVLGSWGCYWDCRGNSDAAPMAALITRLVLEWDPMDPVDSMFRTAAATVGCPMDELRKAVMENHSGGPFAGNALADFFNWNPFSEPPIDEAYEHWCWVNVYKGPEAEVIQRQADRALGKALLKQINARIHETNEGYITALCCSPRRFEGGSLHFWINTGRQTQIDGWKTQAEIEAFIASDGVLADTARY